MADVPSGPESCGYRGPKHPVSRETPPDFPIAADLEGNHATGDINVLHRWGGTSKVRPGDPLFQQCREFLSDAGTTPPRNLSWRRFWASWGAALAILWLLLGVGGGFGMTYLPRRPTAAS